MTGGRICGTGKYIDICKGIGVDEAHIRIVVPLKKILIKTSQY